jgi:formylglycine-generating enzyme required for sulfatase activity
MLQQTADAFVDARLLVSDQSGAARTLEVSHEALIREWDRLRDWLHEAREDVTLMKRIAADAAEWAAKGQPEEAVYRGRRLREAQDWAANNTANATETAFIDASAEAEQAQIAAEEQRKAELRLAAERAEQAAKDAQQSAERAEYQRRRALLAVGFAGLIIAVALIVGVLATQQVNEANVQVANANATLMPIPGTLVAANAQVAAAGTAQDAAEARAAAANAQVANANATLTPIPGTLAAAAAQLNHATATLGFVQGQGTQVAAQATYFGIEQARIGTLAAGAVVIPPGTLTPELLLPTLTGVAQLRRWEPRIIVDKITGVQIEMVEVPPGCFIMGSIASGDEGPVNEQCFTGPFYIDRYEVTQAQFTALNGIMEKNFVYPGYQRPVDNITWFEARDFCEDRRKARLPTEREWEYAARGPDSLTYPWGNIFVPENVIYSRTESQGTANVVNVDGSPARPDGASWVGALDMSGNVFEWTSTRFGELNYSRKTLDFKRSFSYPYRPDDGREADETRADYNRRATEQGIYTLRVIRGGSANDYAFNLRSAARTMGVADNWSGYLGFRCARSS